jgi:hypothetical protein
MKEEGESPAGAEAMAGKEEERAFLDKIFRTVFPNGK